MRDTIVAVEENIQSDDLKEGSDLDQKKKNLKLVQEFLEDKKIEPSTSDYLVALSTQSQSFCVGYVDIVNSTRISACLSTEKLSCYYEIFLNSMSQIIGQFRGRVIKNIGDCLLYYFPESLNASEKGLKNCLDCGVTMTKSQGKIREQLAAKKLPPLNYRISSDFGPVICMHTNMSSEVDLIGPPVNMCAKINGCAGNNEFVIGNDLHQVARKLRTFCFGETNGCDMGFKFPYPVYTVNPSYR
jgi:class 3 adenylate cyclase